MSRIGQQDRSWLRPFEQARHRLVGYAVDYPAGHYTGRHPHPRAQLLYAISGVMRVETDTALYIVPPTNALWLPTQVPHAVRMPDSLRMRALFLRESAARLGPDAVAVITVSGLLRELILAACDEGAAWNGRLPAQPVTALVLHEIRCAATRPLALPACRDPRLVRLAAVLLADPADPRDLPELADLAGASARTLARLFRRDTGMGFQQWRRQLRLTEAFARIAQGETPSRAAAAVGYASGPAFGAAFRTAFGVTPGRARMDAQAVEPRELVSIAAMHTPAQDLVP
jgi:AraC-like DNA-binding protein/quercetin dioxygenase-like cupin family protein